jgi:ferredoxin
MDTITINKQRCIKCARCVALFPDNFDLEKDTGIATVKSTDNAIYEIEQVCPVKAITVTKEEKE